MSRIQLSPAQIEQKLEFWFLDWHRQQIEAFDGSETFTLFRLLPEDWQAYLLSRLDLAPEEKVVLVLKATPADWVLNTTERFIRLGLESIESLPYESFSHHAGYDKPFGVADDGQRWTMKEDGLLGNFKLVTLDDKELTWKIPSGHPGFAFWNITKKCFTLPYRPDGFSA